MEINFENTIKMLGGINKSIYGVNPFIAKFDELNPTGNCFFCGDTTYNGDRDCEKCDYELSHADDYKQDE